MPAASLVTAVVDMRLELHALENILDGSHTTPSLWGSLIQL